MLCRACQRNGAAAVAIRGAPSPQPVVHWLSRAYRTAPLSLREPNTCALPPAANSTGLPSSTRFFPSISHSLCRLRPYSAASASAPVRSTSSPAPSLEKPGFLDEAESRIWDILASEFTPVELSVRDISGGCGSMYGIEISSERFRGATMLKQQRMVNAALGDLMKGWHGVQLKTRVP